MVETADKTKQVGDLDFQRGGNLNSPSKFPRGYSLHVCPRFATQLGFPLL